MKKVLLTLLLALAGVPAHAIQVYGDAIAGVTAGSLTLKCTQTRTSGVSPLLVLFECTATTDTATLPGANNPFQDVQFLWAFGDTGKSGTDTWAYGSNPGGNSKNLASGAVAAHLYITQGRDASYTAIVSAFDGTNTAVGGIGVQAFDPNGASGYPGTNTTCVAATTTPVAGVGGCPAGAGVLQQANFNTAITSKLGAGKRVLFKCNDTFTANDTPISGVNESVGAYGGCEGTQVSRPILNSAGTSDAAMTVQYTAGDVRISDLNCQGGGTGHGCVDGVIRFNGGHFGISHDVTLWNLNSSGNSTSYVYSQGHAWGLIGLTQTSAKEIACYINYSENNPGTYVGNTFNDINFVAILGGSFSGPGAGGGPGIEACRLSGGLYGAIENNDFFNANSTGAPLKLHNGNTYGSCGNFDTVGGGFREQCPNSGTSTGFYPCVGTPNAFYQTPTCWTGLPTAYYEVSDNHIFGTSGAQIFEEAPQNNQSDERLHDFVVERNFFDAPTGAQGGMSLEISGSNTTLRDNVIDMTQGSATIYPITGIGVGQRGPIVPASTKDEVYNNTFYSPNSHGQSAIVLSGAPMGDLSPTTTNSFIKNNLVAFTAGGNAAVAGTGGGGNTISNNSPTITANPGFVNLSGSFSKMSDFKATANFSGGTSVPVACDATPLTFNGATGQTICTPWSPTWSLGAFHP